MTGSGTYGVTGAGGSFGTTFVRTSGMAYVDAAFHLDLNGIPSDAALHWFARSLSRLEDTAFLAAVASLSPDPAKSAAIQDKCSRMDETVASISFRTSLSIPCGISTVNERTFPLTEARGGLSVDRLGCAYISSGSPDSGISTVMRCHGTLTMRSLKMS